MLVIAIVRQHCTSSTYSRIQVKKQKLYIFVLILDFDEESVDKECPVSIADMMGKYYNFIIWQKTYFI